MLNRTAIILRYQEPFVRWINEADPVVEEPNIDIEPDECTAAQSTSIRKTSLRNCDTPVVKDETALPAARARFAKSSVPETEPCRSSPDVVAAMTARFPATTWAKLVRQRGWRRPRRRVYPAKPKTGIRATHPNEYWHIDVTVIRLLDDTKCYLHAVIDNFSRRILSWRLSERLDPITTCEILKDAGKNLQRTPSVAVPAFARKLYAVRAAHRFLRQRAQYPNAAQCFRSTNTRRGVLRPSRSSPGTPHDRAASGSPREDGGKPR